MSSSSDSSSCGTSRFPRARSAVSRVRGKRVCTQRSSGSWETSWPSRSASARPSGVSATGTAGSPFTRPSTFSVECAWRVSRKRRKPAEPTRPGSEGSCLNGRVQAQVEELPENRVRLTVQVPSHDVHHALEHATSDLAQSVKVPGFRKGKVPQRVLVQKVGRDRLMTEAIESHIGGWFWNAAAQTRVRPVAQPEYDFELPGSDEEDWHFTATFPVQAKPDLPDWKTLEVGAIEPEVPEELVQQELDALRATVAELVPVEGRPVGPDDTVIVDMVSPDGGTRRDYVVELGRGAVVEEIEQGIVGLSPGETKDMEFELVDGSKQTVSVTVKEIKEKVLPPLDDELARAASEFDSFADLRGDIESRLREQIEEEIEAQFRSDVADALVEASKVDASGPHVDTG